MIKEGRDIIAESKTGAGKTLAFLLPIFENISLETNSIQALIVPPTRELAIQIAEELDVVLHKRGYDCQKIHSDILKSKRERIMKAFKVADFQYLIAAELIRMKYYNIVRELCSKLEVAPQNLI